MSLAGKHVAILVEADFEDDELAKPLQAMTEANAQVTIVGGESSKEYTGKRNRTKITSDITADKIDADKFEAVIIPGGYAPDRMRLHPEMVDFVKQMYEKEKLVAAVCHGPQLMISANIVKGKHMTSWKSVAIDLKNAGAKWEDEEVVEDGNIITSRQPADLAAFDKAIIDWLETH